LEGFANVRCVLRDIFVGFITTIHVRGAAWMFRNGRIQALQSRFGVHEATVPRTVKRADVLLVARKRKGK